jgi:hypothetical protein
MPAFIGDALIDRVFEDHRRPGVQESTTGDQESGNEISVCHDVF